MYVYVINFLIHQVSIIIKYTLVSRIFNSESLLMFLGKQPQPKAAEKKSAATMNGKFSYCIVG